MSWFDKAEMNIAKMTPLSAEQASSLTEGLRLRELIGRHNRLVGAFEIAFGYKEPFGSSTCDEYVFESYLTRLEQNAKEKAELDLLTSRVEKILTDRGLLPKVKK
jgi:hypothetical protein